MELSEGEKNAIANLVDMAWKGGYVRSREDGALLEALKAKVKPPIVETKEIK